ncbi:hypothetical protein ACLB2K_045777 [Fragaria x ananassa]
MSKPIDEVTASFATSLALAGDGVLDVLSRLGANLHRNSQAYLLAKPLAQKCVNPADLQQTFRKIWCTEGKFKLQSLFFWVRLENIPPRLETPTVIEDASIVAGDDPYVDLNLLNSTGEVRVRVSHALDKPFIFEKVLKLALGIVKNVVFFYENLVAICASCKLIYHLDGICYKKVAKSIVQEPQKENWVEALVNLTNLNYSQDSLKFTGVQSGVAMSSILKPIQPQMPSKSLTRKLIVIKKSLLGFKVTKRPVLVEIGTNGLEPAGNEDDVPAMSLELLLVFTDVQPIDQAMQEPKDTPLSCVSKNCNLNSS